LRQEDLEKVDVDGDNDLRCPYCAERALTAAFPPEEREERRHLADRGIYG
jgi:DNA-directed RNA polymerase subunit RPC12/RpoP